MKQPLRPEGGEWIRKPFPDNCRISENAEGWEHPPTNSLVISGVEENGAGPEYHISVSKYERGCSDEESMAILRIFGMDNAQEDNVGPQPLLMSVRHFWQPVRKTT